jgi:hypothetical protein
MEEFDVRDDARDATRREARDLSLSPILYRS